ncbi:hypothetical protein QDR37_11000 [Amnibacterium sp. CER49]|uniref:hypothetical protein n=1 Tax=Amnibacterium sp. CER49 TaxID=3039161 RepID=UPI0024491947|nr:hypothetical protein [Amnibacterium sp. CER49]MDH2444471.1 hypothetical protein [Amnibacterium sp. CER49]
MSAGTEPGGAEAVAQRLYGLPLGDFIGARTEQVRAARTEGDRALATAIGALAKPTVAAWLVNRLTRERADQTTQLLDLGASLRQATAELDAAALRELGVQRRRLVNRVAAEAADLAAGDGRHPAQGVLDEVAATLNAAMVSDAAAVAVATGRLVKALPVEGIDGAELDEYVALPPLTPGGEGRQRLRAVPSPAAPAAPAAPSAEERRRLREREEAQRAVEAADRALQRAERRAADTGDAVEDGEGRVDALTRRTDGLRERLDELRRQLHEAEDELQDAEDVLTGARTAQRAARREVDDAREALDRARDAERRLA